MIILVLINTVALLIIIIMLYDIQNAQELRFRDDDEETLWLDTPLRKPRSDKGKKRGAYKKGKV